MYYITVDYLATLYIEGEQTYTIEDGEKVISVMVDRKMYALSPEAMELFENLPNPLMTGPSGISMFPSTSSRETLRFSGNKIHCSLRDQSLSVYYLHYSGRKQV